MSKKLIYLISFVLLLGVLQAVPAEAQSIEFEFGGIVTDVQPGLDPPWDQVDVNDQWSIVYTFDPTTTDSTPSPTRGDYWLTITSYTLTIGSVIDWDSSPSGVSHISVFNNRPPAWDQYEVWISGPGGQYDWFMQLDGPNTIWDTDELPLCGDIELSDFSTRDFRLTGWDPFGDGEINGSVDYHKYTPIEVSNPSPADGATCVDPNVILSWSPACLATEHHVYFGTTPNALALVATKPLGDESYNPGPLELGTTYYWQIVEQPTSHADPVWSFTVSPAYLIVDFFRANDGNKPDPVGDSYPMDVKLSNGEWMREFIDVNHIEIGVPESFTFQISYEWGNYMYTIRPIIDIVKGETGRYEVFAYDLESLLDRKEMYVAYREVDANENIAYDWDANTLTLGITISGNPGKVVGLFANIGTASKTHATDPMYVCNATTDNGKAKAKWCLCGEWSLDGWSVEVHVHSGVKASSTSVYYSVEFTEIDGNTNGLVGIYDFYYNDAILDNSKELGQKTSLYDVESGQTISPQYYYPQYSAPGGNYILQMPESMPNEYVKPPLPLIVSNGYGQTPSIHLHRKDEIAPYNFYICAQEAIADSSFSNLQHDQEEKTLTVDVSTKWQYDNWWAYLVLPDDVWVKNVSVVKDTNSTDLEEEYDYIVDGACGYKMVVVRIAPSVDRVRLSYCKQIPGDLNEDCFVDFFDVAILVGNWLECSYKPDLDCTWEP